ncbi:MAG: CPBP family intramembrane metalloprotease [Dysgonamonadaceae bacterium]|jgi:membrane protease YdiL (CAAX protease family)|nr:CPBP family intramembrane metalloprotease [Dysgonamonadaceae bacterium]
MKFLEHAFNQPNQFWRYLLVFAGAFLGGQIIGSIPLACVIAVKTFSSGIVPQDANLVVNLLELGISKNLLLFLIMLGPVTSLICTILLIKLLHKSDFSETVNGTKKLRIRRIISGAAVWGILMAAYLLIDNLINPGDYILQFDLFKFIPLLLISLVFIPLQTTSEELLLRGYLAQGIAGWTRSRWLALLIPALVFGLMHAFNPEVETFGFWQTMPQYIFFGLIFGLTAILDDGIELAIGIHAANNVFLSLFTTHTASVLQTDAVFEQININLEKETLMLFFSGIIVIVYFAWKYKWNFKILNRKVDELTS